MTTKPWYGTFNRCHKPSRTQFLHTQLKGRSTTSNGPAINLTGSLSPITRVWKSFVFERIVVLEWLLLKKLFSLSLTGENVRIVRRTWTPPVIVQENVQLRLFTGSSDHVVILYLLAYTLFSQWPDPTTAPIHYPCRSIS